jgi:hypothetical protein
LRRIFQMDIFPIDMDSEKIPGNRPMSFAIGTMEPKTGAGNGSGVFNVYSMSASAILVNISTATRFDYRLLYRITSLAMRTGGQLEICNEDIAIFAFPQSGISAFMEGIGFEIRVLKTVVSTREKGISKVNIRFQPG